jgi:site-specific DNA recombinase
MGRRLASVPDQPGRVVLYVRVSALMGRGGDDFHSPDVQTGAMRRATVGMREVAVVQDIDRSGRTFSREGIDRIRAMAEAKQIDALAVYDVSRLGRNVRESLTFLTWLADHGVTILSACEQVDTSTPAGRLMLTNMLAIAEYRSDELGRSWSATIARRQARGQHHGTVPLGYTRTGDGCLEPDTVLGPVIAKAWKDYAAGVSIRRIAEAVAAARGRAVMASNLKTIFRRRVYLGHIEVDGEIVAHDAHDPLVDQDTWEAVQRRLLRDAKTPARNLEMTWALVGLAYCPADHRLQRNPRKTPDGPVERLICGMSSSRAAGGCPGIGAPRMELVENKVLAEVRTHIGRLRTDDAARAEQLARTASATVDEKALRRRLNQVTEAIGKMAKAWALGDLTDDEYAPVAELRAEAETIRDQLAAVTPAKDRPTPEQLATAAEVLVALWPDATPEERNRMLRPIVAKVVVRRAARWREPVEDCVDVQFL